MAEGDVTFYNIFKQELGLGTIDWEADTLKITLHTSYTPDIDAHEGWADVSATEYGTGDGYTAGGETLATAYFDVDDANDRADFGADAVTWSSLGALSPATPGHAIVWDDTHASDCLICYIELGSTATNGGDYTIDISGDLGRLS